MDCYTNQRGPEPPEPRRPQTMPPPEQMERINPMSPPMHMDCGCKMSPPMHMDCGCKMPPPMHMDCGRKMPPPMHMDCGCKTPPPMHKNCGCQPPSATLPSMTLSRRPESPMPSKEAMPYCAGMAPDCMMQYPIAMAYVPWQQWKQPYPLDRGFQRGTIFPELDLPFMMGRCR